MFSRTELLIGKDALSKLNKSHVIVFGCGGVGGYVIEALVRSGIGKLTVVDNDTITVSNLNRQIIALQSTIGMDKTEAVTKRALDINPEIKITARKCFFLPENADTFNFSEYDYVVDAVDTVTAKIKIIECAKAAGVPVISSMGTGNKLDPSKFQIADISKTSVCPLARVMRRELKKRGISRVNVLFSTEEPVKASPEEVPSIAFVPSAAGLIIAGKVIRDICEKQE